MGSETGSGLHVTLTAGTAGISQGDTRLLVFRWGQSCPAPPARRPPPSQASRLPLCPSGQVLLYSPCRLAPPWPVPARTSDTPSPPASFPGTSPRLTLPRLFGFCCLLGEWRVGGSSLAVTPGWHRPIPSRCWGVRGPGRGAQAQQSVGRRSAPAGSVSAVKAPGSPHRRGRRVRGGQSVLKLKKWTCKF